MKNREFQIDYKWEEEPLLVLPLCAGAMLLSGELFRWLHTLDPAGQSEGHLIFLKFLYLAFLLCCSALALWRVVRTIHATEQGLEYRFLGRIQKRISWSEFACAFKGRSYCYRNDLIYLIPEASDVFPADPWERSKFCSRNYRSLIHFHPTQNNIRAIGTYLKGL